MSRPPLRVAVLVDDLVVPAWIGEVLRRLDAMEQVDLRLLVVNAERAPRRPLPVRAWRTRRKLAFRIYEAIDARLWGRPGDGFDADDVSADLAHVRRLEVTPVRTTPYERRFDAETIAALRAEDLDVVVRFGFGIIRGEILDVPRYGVWSYHHGDTVAYRGGPSFFWEMARRDPVSKTVLQVLTEELDNGHVLYRSVSATDRSSLRRSRSRGYLKTLHFLERRLADLHAHGWEYLQALDTFPVTPDPEPIRRAPSNAQVVTFALRTWGAIAWRFLLRRVTYDRWFVAYRPRREDPGPPVSSGGWKEIEPPPGHFYADPFLLEHDGRTWLFFEDYIFARGRAHIAVLEIRADGTTSPPQVVFDPPHHLSYPYVFAHDGEVYLVPESAEAKRVELWRAVELPGRWELAAVLFDGHHMYDPTIIRHEGRWWMFLTLAVPGASPDDELHVFHAPEVTGPWTPHARNPVRSDVRSSRPAGRIVQRDGKLLRPAQDGSGRYGAAINWQEITTLTEERYAERTVHRTGSEVLPRVLATHTYDFSDGWEAIDGQRWITRHSRPRPPRARLGRRA